MEKSEVTKNLERLASPEGLEMIRKSNHIPSIIAENKKMKEAIDLLTKEEWSTWAQNMIPNCPKWQIVRRAMGEAEIGFNDFGTYASTFVKLAAKDAL